MTFVTGTYTNANPGPALYAALETSLVSVGFTLVDTVVISTRTHKVLQAPANSFGLGWFLDISYPTTGVATGVKTTPFEDYNAASHLGFRGPYGAGSADMTVPESTYYSRYGSTGYALETNWSNSAANTGFDTALSTGATTYWASITPERVVLMLSSAPTKLSYAGFFTPTPDFIAAADTALYPLISVTLTAAVNAQSSTAGASTAAVTRLPKLTGFSGAAGSRTNVSSWVGSVFVGALDWGVRFAAGGLIGVGGSLFTGKTSISPIPVVLGTAAPSPTLGMGALVGVLDGVAAGQAAPSAVRGDTVEVDSDTWLLSSPVGYQVLLIQEK